MPIEQVFMNDFCCNEARLKVGVLTDVHIKEPASANAGTISSAYYGDGCQNGWPTSSETFRHALTYFRDQNVDAVVITGDMADLGLICQLETLMSIWNSVFPGDQAPDGHHVERIFITGNHEWCGVNFNCVKRLYPDDKERVAANFVSDPAGIWERIFGEKYTPIFIKDVKGYKFVCAHWQHAAGIDGMEKFLAEHREEISGGRPFFVLQHLHPAGTCSAGIASGDDGRARKILSKYPNAVAFSGHSHKSLTDERTIWQGEFTSVGLSSLRMVQTPPGCENGNCTVNDPGINGVSQMAPLDAFMGRQGMVMTVYDDQIFFSRRDFLTGTSLGPAWVIPLPVSKSVKPYSLAYRRENEEIPEFPPSASVAIVREDKGKDRAGNIIPQLHVDFPSVMPFKDGTRVCEYSVKAIRTKDRSLIREKHIHSPDYILPLSKRIDRVRCTFAASDFENEEDVSFEVTPLGFFGAVGNPITNKSI